MSLTSSETNEMEVLCVAAPISCWLMKHIGSALPVSEFMNSSQLVLNASAFSMGTVKSKLTQVWALRVRPMKAKKPSVKRCFIDKDFREDRAQMPQGKANFKNLNTMVTQAR